uniref:Serpentine receptor class gamma n=1 Tax=Ditylenchus dipsaci TaxID=166011 RepID=A0A915EFF2_9BILA
MFYNNSKRFLVFLLTLKRASITLLLLQLAFYYYSGEYSNRNLDTYELIRLNHAFWTRGNRFMCIIHIFTISMLSILRFVLANLDETSTASPKFLSQLFYYVLLIMCFTDNSLLFLYILRCNLNKVHYAVNVHEWRMNGVISAASAA